MRLIGYRDGETRYIGAVEGDTVLPIATLDDFYTDPAGRLEQAQGSQAARLALSGLSQVPPVPMTAKVFCVGLNYRAHAEEAGATVPDHPTVFGRWHSTLVGDGESIPVPSTEHGLDWEVELAVVIGETLIDADEGSAPQAVLGYTAFNDVSARSRQFDTTQWTLGKNPDKSAPIGPVLVTADEWDSGRDHRLTTKVNGELMQSGYTSDMIFSIGRVLSYISQTSTLRPGDVVALGTPEGVGFTRTPPRLLVPGDVVEVEVEGIGVLSNPITGVAGRS
ncbi:fumarylacetoacetate hydrolase family protein [Rhizohabitans arisaemae]|uniref:fumarylacetoacetate hydrolase family protein n=1 Tax=Rhizohabitans arisaemae TaxID=2720610 RepID=UPI0024B13134|nr:fumarylacetoacetate hydrolase family protein [Rhizohabitans arisaemae]